jgi:hypothetical protein
MQPNVKPYFLFDPPFTLYLVCSIKNETLQCTLNSLTFSSLDMTITKATFVSLMGKDKTFHLFCVLYTVLWIRYGFTLCQNTCFGLLLILHTYYSSAYVLQSVLSGSLSPRHGASSGCGWRNGLQLWRVAANTMNKQLWTSDKELSSSLGAGRGASNSLP